MTTKCHKLPCSHCGSDTHERHTYGGLTLCYCVDDEACHERLLEKERKKAGLKYLEQEIKTDENKRTD